MCILPWALVRKEGLELGGCMFRTRGAVYSLVLETGAFSPERAPAGDQHTVG